MPGLNDSDEQIRKVQQLSAHCHAVVFTGLFFREEIQNFFRENNIPDPYSETARRKILPEEMESRILAAFRAADFRTNCFGRPHAGRVRAPSCRLQRPLLHSGNLRHLPGSAGAPLRLAHRKPSPYEVGMVATELGAVGQPQITDRAIQVSGLDEQRRYFIQHRFGYQVHDRKYPHQPRRHGRADIGWAPSAPSMKIAISGTHSTGKTTFLDAVRSAVAVVLPTITKLAPEARDLGFPILKQHTFASTLWLMAAGIKYELGACLKSPVVLDLPARDGSVRILECSAETPERKADSATKRMPRRDRPGYAFTYDVLIKTVVDESQPIANNKSGITMPNSAVWWIARSSCSTPGCNYRFGGSNLTTRTCFRTPSQPYVPISRRLRRTPLRPSPVGTIVSRCV